MGDYEDKRALFEKAFKAENKARDEKGGLEDDEEEFL